jgi:hypothetical protein
MPLQKVGGYLKTVENLQFAGRKLDFDAFSDSAEVDEAGRIDYCHSSAINGQLLVAVRIALQVFSVLRLYPFSRIDREI